MKYELCIALDIVCRPGSNKDKRYLIVEAENRIQALIDYGVDSVIDSYKDYQRKELMEVADNEEKVMNRINAHRHGGNVVYLKEIDGFDKIKQQLLSKFENTVMDNETQDAFKKVIEEVETYEEKNWEEKIALYNKLENKINTFNGNRNSN